MLASTGEPTFPCWAQPKLDGGRCCYRDNVGNTREGKDYHTVEHITAEVKKYLPEGWILDGELYNHVLHDDFNKIMSLIKRQKPTKQNLEEVKEKVQYWGYDILTGENDDSTENERIKRRKQWFDDNPDIAEFVVFVPTTWVKNQAELDEIHTSYMKDGFEGTILRTPGAKYKRAGRSKELIKKKDFVDDEFEIIDIEEGKGNRSGEAGAIMCKTKDGLTFGAGIKGNEDLRQKLWSNKNKYIGKFATITFFGFTKKVDGLPRFPVYKGINERN
jgi:ATP-dependent DNA ligase